MEKVLETVLLFLIKRVVTPEVIKQGEQAIVNYLKELAQKTDNKVDDYMVKVIAEALGVDY